jgi:hypothetical protein
MRVGRSRANALGVVESVARTREWEGRERIVVVTEIL